MLVLLLALEADLARREVRLRVGPMVVGCVLAEIVGGDGTFFV